MTSVERLVEKLRNLGYPIPEKWTFKRLRPGYWGRIGQAWSWELRWETTEGDPGLVGSTDSVRTLLRAKRIEKEPWNEITAGDK